MTCQIRSCELVHKTQLAFLLTAALLTTQSLCAQSHLAQGDAQEIVKPKAPATAGASHWMQARGLLFTKIIGQDGKQMGEVADIIFLPYGGVLDGAAVKLAASDLKVKVPFSSLQWKAKDRCYATTMTRDQLAAMPAFDAKDYGKKEAVDVAGTGQKETGGIVEAAAKPSQYLLLSNLEQHPVCAGTATIGRIVQVIIEATPRSVAFVTVKAGTDLGQGDVYLIPWRALRFDEAGKLLTSVDAAKLEAAPKFERLESLEDPEYLRKVTAFYGVPAIELPKT